MYSPKIQGYRLHISEHYHETALYLVLLTEIHEFHIVIPTDPDFVSKCSETDTISY